MNSGSGGEKTSWWSRVRGTELRVNAAGYEDKESTDERDARLARIKRDWERLVQSDVRLPNYPELRRKLAEAGEHDIWKNTPELGRKMIAQTERNGEPLSPNQRSWKTVDDLSYQLPRRLDSQGKLHTVGQYSGRLPFEKGKDSDCQISIVPVKDGLRYVVRLFDLNDPPRAYIMDLSPHLDDKSYGGEVPAHLIPELMERLGSEDALPEVGQDGVIPEVPDAPPSEVDWISQHPLTQQTVHELDVELQRIRAKVRRPQA